MIIFLCVVSSWSATVLGHHKGALRWLTVLLGGSYKPLQIPFLQQMLWYHQVPTGFAAKEPGSQTSIGQRTFSGSSSAVPTASKKCGRINSFSQQPPHNDWWAWWIDASAPMSLREKNSEMHVPYWFLNFPRGIKLQWPIAITFWIMHPYWLASHPCLSCPHPCRNFLGSPAKWSVCNQIFASIFTSEGNQSWTPIDTVSNVECGQK